VSPSRTLLELALSRAPELGRSRLAKVFALLSGPRVTPDEAARITAQIIRVVAVSPVQFLDIRAITELALNAMNDKWPAPLCSQLVIRATREALTLLPQHQKTVQQACIEFVRAKMALG
jgi:hypothetical protein